MSKDLSRIYCQFRLEPRIVKSTPKIVLEGIVKEGLCTCLTNHIMNDMDNLPVEILKEEIHCMGPNFVYTLHANIISDEELKRLQACDRQLEEYGWLLDLKGNVFPKDMILKEAKPYKLEAFEEGNNEKDNGTN